MKKLPIAAIALLLMAGCGTNSMFVYKPGAPAAGERKLPVNVAVLPFKDGTEDFTKRGSVLAPETLYYNLAKAGIGGQITALTPDLWAKAFADDMAASGAFRAVRFVYGPSELVDEDLYIEGTLEKATASGAWVNPNEFALGLRAIRRADKKPVWEKEVSRAWKNTAETLYKGCGGVAIQCMVDRHHADANRAMQEIFAEARADLVGTLGSPSGSRAGEDGLPPTASPGEAREEEFVGVGLEVGVVNNALTVVRAMQGAPASKAGMQGGDSILSVDGKPTAGMSVADAVGRIRGSRGSSVTLGVMRAGWNTPRDLIVARDVVREGTPSTQAPESVEQTIDRLLKEK